MQSVRNYLVGSIVAAAAKEAQVSFLVVTKGAMTTLLLVPFKVPNLPLVMAGASGTKVTAPPHRNLRL